jgi:glutamate N-acetyltransferase/amino-acid N-acetyltransferase
VKTAVHGADPNWGRVAMAVGKCSDDADIAQERVVIRFGEHEVYPTLLDGVDLDAVAKVMAADEVRIHVSLGIGDAAFTAYGCDLSAGYVRINADYTT